MMVSKRRREHGYQDPKKYCGLIWFELWVLAACLKLDLEQTKNLFRDGRYSGHCAEYWIVNDNPGLEHAPRNATCDVYDETGKWEIRTITKHGVRFTPSIDIGGGREINKVRLEQKLQDVQGYILCDITTFPVVRYWSIPSRVIVRWHHRDIMKRGRLGYKKAIRLIGEFHEQDQDGRHQPASRPFHTLHPAQPPQQVYRPLL